MKKYRMLEVGEEIQAGDEIEIYGEWHVAAGAIGGKIDEDLLAGSVRRLIPHAGETQFLMHVSILTTVVFDCDGLTQEEIEEKAGELAVEKINAFPKDYIIFENVDFEDSEMDWEQPGMPW